MFSEINYVCKKCKNSKPVYVDHRTPKSFKVVQYLECGHCGSKEFESASVYRSKVDRPDIPEGATIVTDTNDLFLYIACKKEIIKSGKIFSKDEIQARASRMVTHARQQSLFIPTIALNIPWEVPSREEVEEFAKGVFGKDYDKVNIDKLMERYEEGH